MFPLFLDKNLKKKNLQKTLVKAFESLRLQETTEAFICEDMASLKFTVQFGNPDLSLLIPVTSI